MIYVIRLIHGLITAFFLSCIVYIYYAGITNQMNIYVYISVGMILLEMVIIVLNKGICPMGVLHNKFGDTKTFFELLLPKPLAKRAVPFLGFVAALGILLLFI